MSRIISKKRAVILFIFMAGLYSFSFFQRVAVPGTIFNDLQQEFAVGAGAITALSSIYLFIYASQQFFIGMLTDKFGGVKVTIISGVILCLGAILFPLSHSLWALYLSRAMIGLGAGAMYLSGIKEIDSLFKAKNFAPLVGVFCVIGYGGGLLGTRPFRGLVDIMGWRDALMAVAIFAVIILFIIFIVGYNISDKKQNAGKKSALENVKLVLSNGRAYPLLIAVMINFSLYFTIQSTIGVKFICDFLKLETTQASDYTFVMMFFTLSTMLFVGVISRKVGNKRKPFIAFGSVNSFSAVILLLCGILFKLPAPFFMVAYAMLAVSAGLTPVTVSFVKELNHKDAAGLSVGALNTSVYISVAIATGLVGLILDMFKNETIVNAAGTRIYPPMAYALIFSVMLLFAIISVVAAFKTQETSGKNIYERLNNIL